MIVAGGRDPHAAAAAATAACAASSASASRRIPAPRWSGAFDEPVGMGFGATQAYEVPLHEQGFKLESLVAAARAARAARRPASGGEWQRRLGAARTTSRSGPPSRGCARSVACARGCFGGVERALRAAREGPRTHQARRRADRAHDVRGGRGRSVSGRGAAAGGVHFARAGRADLAAGRRAARLPPDGLAPLRHRVRGHATRSSSVVGAEPRMPRRAPAVRDGRERLSRPTSASIRSTRSWRVVFRAAEWLANESRAQEAKPSTRPAA